MRSWRDDWKKGMSVDREGELTTVGNDFQKLPSKFQGNFDRRDATAVLFHVFTRAPAHGTNIHTSHRFIFHRYITVVGVSLPSTTVKCASLIERHSNDNNSHDHLSCRTPSWKTRRERVPGDQCPVSFVRPSSSGKFAWMGIAALRSDSRNFERGRCKDILRNKFKEEDTGFHSRENKVRFVKLHLSLVTLNLHLKSAKHRAVRRFRITEESR